MFLSSLLSIVEQHLLLALSLSVVLFSLLLVLYRLYLHPLAPIPGPKLAAVTRWYEFYYDVVRKGDYTRKIEELHEIYGPIIRISPNELHCNDPAFIDQIYAPGGGKRKRDKTYFYGSGVQFWEVVPPTKYGIPKFLTFWVSSLLSLPSTTISTGFDEAH